MDNTNNEKDLDAQLEEVHKKLELNAMQRELAQQEQNDSRGRCLSVGTAGGGTVEISIRGDYASLWYQLNAVEGVEIINQLAAALGLDIVHRPRQDYATWRGWDPELTGAAGWLGMAPWQMDDKAVEELLEYKSKNLFPGTNNPNILLPQQNETRSE